MGIPKLSGFIIGLVLISFFATSFTFLISGFAGKYGVSFDNETMANYNKLDTIQTDVEEVKTQIDDQLELDPSFLDVIGAYLKGGYKTLKISLNSFNTFEDVVDSSISDSNLAAGNSAYNPLFISQLKTAIILIVLIMVLFILIGIFVGREKI